MTELNANKTPIELLIEQTELLRTIHEEQKVLTLKIMEFQQAQIQRESGKTSSVYISDINMSIVSMIEFMVKWLIASIPVAAIIGVLWLFIFILISS